MRAGWRAARQRNEVETGIDVLAALRNPSTASWQLALDLDQNDGLYFPSRGWQVQAAYFNSPQRAYARLTVDPNGAAPLGSWVPAPASPIAARRPAAAEPGAPGRLPQP